MAVADLILHDARIFTVDPSRPRAEAIRIVGGRITEVGPEREVLAGRSPRTRLRSLGGAFVMPGIVDGHNHPAEAGPTALFELGLDPGAGVDAILDRVRARAEQAAPGAWIMGPAGGRR